MFQVLEQASLTRCYGTAIPSGATLPRKDLVSLQRTSAPCIQRRMGVGQAQATLSRGWSTLCNPLAVGTSWQEVMWGRKVYFALQKEYSLAWQQCQGSGRCIWWLITSQLLWESKVWAGSRKFFKTSKLKLNGLQEAPPHRGPATFQNSTASEGLMAQTERRGDILHSKHKTVGEARGV